MPTIAARTATASTVDLGPDKSPKIPACALVHFEFVRTTDTGTKARSWADEPQDKIGKDERKTSRGDVLIAAQDTSTAACHPHFA